MAHPQLGYSMDDSVDAGGSTSEDVELLRRKVSRLEGEVSDLKDALRDERERSATAFRSMARLKSALSPFYKALQMIFGELDDVDGDQGGAAAGSSAAANQPVSEAAYRAWKDRLPPSCGKIIDALLVQPLNNSQLKTLCKLGTSTVIEAIGILKKNNLVDKQDGLNRLRRL